MAIKKLSLKLKKRHIILLSFFLVLLLIFIFVALPLYSLKMSSDKFLKDVNIIKADEKSKNIVGIVAQIPIAQKDLTSVHNNLHKFSYVKILPVVSDYYKNADYALNAGDDMFKAVSLMMNDIVRAASLLESKSTSSNASGAVKLQTIAVLLPQLEPKLIESKPFIEDAKSQLQMINPQYMPSSYKGINLKDGLSSSISILNYADNAIPQLQTYIPLITDALGVGSSKNYLLLFQNDKELRPTGGFITAFGFLKFINGSMQQINSRNIYDMDQYFTKHVTPPIALTRYNAATTWTLRDANLSPDAPTSVKDIYWFYNQTKTMPPVDGVLFVDTQFVSDLLTVTGPIKVPGYNETVDSSNVAYKMEYYAEKVERSEPDSIRKRFMSSVDTELTSQLMKAPKEKWIPLLNTVLDALNNKDMIFYLNDPNLENFVLSKNWGDEVVKNNNGDYLDLVEANLGGAKADFYIKRTITDNIVKLNNGNYEITLNIKYSNNQIYDDWLNGPYRAWFRLYVPMGSKLVSMSGFDGVLEIHNDTNLNKTYFDDHIRVPVKYHNSDPAATLNVQVKYIVPSSFNTGDTYNLLIQKEAGISPNEYVINYNGKSIDQILNTDTTFHL